ncbi:hypothetical protein CC1G_08414 [Coprinopsis cinerea okayama7|uniref:DUF6534 domain-containing protein n=1 Tax=Coprinopsis cinerea (strain Okayama-7 / 130 / ATCC MYA-4618 / FGSC 9003) TaxID=240176 RepID=A8NAP5_COPC7|nr:hypothetical protein CC1G_08414 [Coprinopsis cinerea okayama7\|eukprot:XP_001831897.2 hypothetical protein CC1G_08414 [Coprinopsis cinerea okayama7\
MSEGPNPVLIAGPVLIGSIAAFMLYGGLVVQVHTYALSCVQERRSNPTRLNLLVGFVTLLETLNICFVFHATWHALITVLSLPPDAVKYASTGPFLQITTSLVVFAVQMFFGWRIYIVSSIKLEKIFLSACVVLTAIAGLILAILVGHHYLTNSMGHIINLVVVLQLGFNLVCDAFITIGMVILLLRYKHEINIAETKHILNSLTLHTLENGLATTIIASLNLLFFLKRDGDLIHAAFNYLIGRLYANVLLASLNNRGRLARAASRLSSRTGAGHTTSFSLQFSHTITNRTSLGPHTALPTEDDDRASIVGGKRRSQPGWTEESDR